MDNNLHKLNKNVGTIRAKNSDKTNHKQLDEKYDCTVEESNSVK